MASSPKIVKTQTTDSKTKKMRSPAYPYLNLETAIARARTFYDHEKRNPAPVTVAATHWGYEPKSSGATQTAAALMSFGLMQDEGMSEKRKLKLTENALKILLDTRSDSTDRNELIKQAALAPKVHRQIWTKWASGISDENLKHALVFEWEPPFNENSVDGFIKEFRDTIRFAKLAESDKVASEVQNNGDPGDGKYLPKAGEYVRWESSGVVQFDAKRVTGLSSDGGFAFVEGSKTGLSIAELTKVDVPLEVIQQAPVNSPLSPLKTRMQEFVVPLSEGRAVFQWPTTLSKEDVDDLKDSLKILERKIARSTESEKDAAS